jgi:hypothetical protein
MLHGPDHVIAEAFVKRRFKLMHFFRQPSETAAIDAGHHEKSRQHAVVMCRLESAHFRIQVIKLHSSIPPR